MKLHSIVLSFAVGAAAIFVALPASAESYGNYGFRHERGGYATSSFASAWRNSGHAERIAAHDFRSRQHGFWSRWHWHRRFDRH